MVASYDTGSGGEGIARALVGAPDTVPSGDTPDPGPIGCAEVARAHPRARTPAVVWSTRPGSLSGA